MDWSIKQKILGSFSKKSVLRIPYFVLIISLIVTISITYFFYSSAKTIDRERFENQTVKVKVEIESKLETYFALLRAGRSFFYASDKVNREEFREFVDNLKLRQLYPGVFAIGYSKVFKANEKDSLITEMKNQGIPDFKITPEITRDEGQAIVFIEPLDERNKFALGFDMSSEATRKLALDTARDTGTFATTGKVLLIQDNPTLTRVGFLIYLPVYKNNRVYDSVEARREQIDGFIYSPFRANEFVADIVKGDGVQDLSFFIYDNDLDEKNLLAIGNEGTGLTNSEFSGKNEIDVGGRKWIITYLPTSQFHNSSLLWWTPIIFFLGLAISVILFFLSLSQSWTNQALVKTATDLTQSGVIVQTLLAKENEARTEAEKSAKVKDEFLATISHELRTPLNAIGGWVNVLKLNNVDKETKDKAIGIINKNLRQQTDLIEQILFFSDKDSTLDKENWRIISFSNLVKNCLKEIDAKVSEKNLSLSANLPDNNLKIFGDEGKIKTTIQNLLDNCLKFTPAEGEITVDLNWSKDEIILKIKDSGEGINSELLPLIFEGFRQSDSSIKRKHGGLGLSLAIAKKIIEAHQGKISIESAGEQKGATVTVIFPSAF